jgi:hypothetical protein
MRKSFFFGIVLFVIVSTGAQTAMAQAGNSTPEKLLFASANRERASKGLSPLQWSAVLAAAAQQHALRMAQENTLSHQLPGEAGLKERIAQHGGHFVSMAENIAEGPSAATIHQEWMKSPPHRANLLDPQLDSLGIGVAERSGILFAVKDFSLGGGTLSIPEQEHLVGAQLRSRRLQLLDYTADARRTCTMDNGFAGKHMPSFVLHYATTELQNLPAMLEKRIATGRYHAAAIGACPVGSKGLSGYRLAVMLYE